MPPYSPEWIATTCEERALAKIDKSKMGRFKEMVKNAIAS